MILFDDPNDRFFDPDDYRVSARLKGKIMDEEITLEKITIIQGGLVRLDLQRKQKGEKFRVDIEPGMFFTMFGNALNDNYKHWKNNCEGCEIA